MPLLVMVRLRGERSDPLETTITSKAAMRGGLLPWGRKDLSEDPTGGRIVTGPGWGWE